MTTLRHYDISTFRLFKGDALDHLSWIADDEGKRVLLLRAIYRKCQCEVLAVLQHLYFPRQGPLRKVYEYDLETTAGTTYSVQAN